mmetsp:Transcript_6071/g.24164  ORF Transcript_6071/g.24164 Transcript_6071/m.24164 type:complete len:220 (-) Transcript_6071:1143-1802(-)
MAPIHSPPHPQPAVPPRERLLLTPVGTQLLLSSITQEMPPLHARPAAAARKSARAVLPASQPSSCPARGTPLLHFLSRLHVRPTRERREERTWPRGLLGRLPWRAVSGARAALPLLSHQRPEQAWGVTAGHRSLPPWHGLRGWCDRTAWANERAKQPALRAVLWRLLLPLLRRLLLPLLSARTAWANERAKQPALRAVLWRLLLPLLRRLLLRLRRLLR